MSSTPNNLDPANESSSVTLSTAFLALRERSRVLLRERSQQLHALEGRLQEQLMQLVTELNSSPAPAQDTDASLQRIASLEAEVRHLQQLRRDSELALNEARVMLAEMEDERRALREHLDAEDVSRSRTEEQPDQAELERLQRRLEMAMQEIRELKQQNEDLTSRPAAAASAAPRPHATALDSKLFDWETQKLRLIQELETDFDTQQPEQAKEKLRIQTVIRETDRIIAEKDRELAELRQRLEIHESGPQETSADAAAREQLLDADAVVAAERARLNHLQEEWREKLRKSEVEISIERAKVARERLQLEEKIRTLQVQATESEVDGGKSDDCKSGTPPRGRWLNRLGLGGTE